MQTWRKFLFGKSEDCFSSSWWYRGARDSPGKEVKMNQTVPGVADRCIQDPYSSVSKGWIPWYKGGTSCGWYFPLFEIVVTSPSQVPLLSWASSAFLSYLHAHIALILVKKVFPSNVDETSWDNQSYTGGRAHLLYWPDFSCTIRSPSDCSAPALPCTWRSTSSHLQSPQRFGAEPHWKEQVPANPVP